MSDADTITIETIRNAMAELARPREALPYVFTESQMARAKITGEFVPRPYVVAPDRLPNGRRGSR